MPSVLSLALPAQGFGVVCARRGAGGGMGSVLLLEHWEAKQFLSGSPVFWAALPRTGCRG